MIATTEIPYRVAHAVDVARQTHGYLHPSHTLEVLRQDVGDAIGLPYGNLRRAIDRHPTRNFLFPDTTDTLGTFVRAGDAIQIWTNNTVVRVATSGIGQIRRQFPREERWRLGVAAAENNKVSLLPQLLKTAVEREMPVVIVDDAPKNLAKAADVAEELHMDMPMALVLAQMLGTDQPYLLNRPHSVITEMLQLLLFREDFQAFCRKRGFPTGIYWLIDFDNTLIDKDAHERSIQNELSQHVIFSATDERTYENV